MRGKRMLRVKVCGLAEAENLAAVEALRQGREGLAYSGMIFYGGSARRVRFGAEEAPWGMEGVCRTGVFVNAVIEEVVETVGAYGLGAVQLHGDESAEYVKRLRGLVDEGTTIIKAVSVGSGEDLEKCGDYDKVADLLLLDTAGAGRGGSGRQFDWGLLEGYRSELPFMLSGGIGPEDAGRIKELKHPKLYGVDLNSRFEIRAGVKDVELIRRFIKELSE